MNAILIFIYVWIAMIALSFIESYVEGRNVWDKKKYGWKIQFSENRKINWKNFRILQIKSA